MTKNHQTVFGDQTTSNIVWSPNILTVWTPCLVLFSLMLFDGVWSCLKKLKGLDKREMFGDQTPSNVFTFGGAEL